jgi:hypothetical protein
MIGATGRLRQRLPTLPALAGIGTQVVPHSLPHFEEFAALLARLAGFSNGKPVGHGVK